MGRLLAAIVAFVITVSAQAQTIAGRVVGVSDGDTITVLDAQRVQKRYDWPESTHLKSGKPSGTCQSKISREWFSTKR